MVSEKQLDFSSILASSVHDMKNSLGMVLNSLDEIFEKEGECHCTPSQAARLQYEAKRVNNNLIQLLVLYKVEHAHYSANIVENLVDEFLEEIVLQNKPLVNPKGISLDRDCPEDVYGYFDGELIAGALNNALGNALRYTRDRLRLSATEEAGYLVIRVEDNGDGFPEPMLLGEGHEDHGVSFSTGRTGLGQYFCARVAEMHTNGDRKGYIELSNGGELGGGCFSIYLP